MSYQNCTFGNSQHFETFRNISRREHAEPRPNETKYNVNRPFVEACPREAETARTRAGDRTVTLLPRSGNRVEFLDGTLFPATTANYRAARARVLAYNKTRHRLRFRSAERGH